MIFLITNMMMTMGRVWVLAMVDPIPAIINEPHERRVYSVAV